MDDLVSNNKFSMEYYKSFLKKALDCGYKFVTLNEFVTLGCPNKGYFVIRHDLDKQPMSLKHVIEAEHELGITSTIFVRIAGADYNLFSYPCFELISSAAKWGMEIGLHSNFVEFSKINDLNHKKVLSSELDMLRSYFTVTGIATHRDINYMYNSLPSLEKDWHDIKKSMQFSYHAYEDRIMSKTVYVNEGLNPHICWRSLTPEQVIETGSSIYMLTHPHWWYKNHAFETP